MTFMKTVILVLLAGTLVLTGCHRGEKDGVEILKTSIDVEPWGINRYINFMHIVVRNDGFSTKRFVNVVGHIYDADDRIIDKVEGFVSDLPAGATATVNIQVTVGADASYTKFELGSIE